MGKSRGRAGAMLADAGLGDAGLADAERGPAARSRPSPRLLLVFAVLLLLPVAGLGAALDHVQRAGTAERTLDDARSSARLLAQASVQPAVAGQDLGSGLDIAGVSDLGAAVDAAARDGQVVRLRLVSPDGAVVFPPQDVGRALDTATVADLAATTAGEEAPARLTTAAMPGWLGGARVRVVEVYAPVAAPDGRVLGTLQVALPYERVALRAEQQTALSGAVLLAGLVGLYAVVAALAWVVTRRLRRQLAITDHQAHHDPLTGLPNRTLFRLRAAQAVAGGGRAVVAVIDLDRFKQVNDTLGHPTGDVLLREVGRRLGAAVRAGDTVARQGGDEFGIVLPGVDVAGAGAVLDRVRAALGEPCRVEGLTLPVAGSMGVVACPEHGTTVEDLLRQADVAMYAAKRSGRGIVTTQGVSGPAEREAALEDLLLEAELDHALATDGLVLHYQPLTDLASGRVVRVEALVRWQHPERGLVGPDRFLPLAETTGQVHELTWWVLRRALADLGRLRDDVGVAVNVSPSTLRGEGFCERVVAMLAAAGQPASRLLLEMTESALVEEFDAVRATLDRLAAAGVALSLDDFGQGSTSLGFLGVLPFTEIKVDRAFVAPLEAPGLASTIVAAIVTIAHDAGMLVVAEGIESEQVLQRVRALGCDVAQGYHLARPAPLPVRRGAPGALATGAVATDAPATGAVAAGVPGAGPGPGC